MKTTSKDKECTSGLTVESLKEIGGPIKWKEKEHLHGSINDNTRGNTKMTRKKVSGSSHGLTGENMMENGLTENSMVEGFTRQAKEK